MDFICLRIIPLKVCRVEKITILSLSNLKNEKTHNSAIPIFNLVLVNAQDKKNQKISNSRGCLWTMPV
jgi:hypothetical protein